MPNEEKETKQNIVERRIMARWANYPVWLEKRGIDFGQQYTDLGEEKQRELVKLFEDEMSEAAWRASGGANYG